LKLKKNLSILAKTTQLQLQTQEQTQEQTQQQIQQKKTNSTKIQTKDVKL
tara:strand:- start:816 stop:965 length:150 start_codon:yes stop_codon:yes gene_type:complete